MKPALISISAPLSWNKYRKIILLIKRQQWHQKKEAAHTASCGK